MIRVPKRQKDTTKGLLEFVELTQEDLPPKTSSIIHMLHQEAASIEFWIEIAVSLLHIYHPSYLPHLLLFAIKHAKISSNLDMFLTFWIHFLFVDS